jgi:hypothetical protein
MRWRCRRNDNAVKLAPADECGNIAGRHIEFSGKPVGMRWHKIGDAAQNTKLCQIAGQVPAPHATSYDSDACHHHLLIRQILERFRRVVTCRSIVAFCYTLPSSSPLTIAWQGEVALS